MASITKVVLQKGLFRIIPIAIVLAVLSVSCRVSLVSPYRKDIAQEIELTSKKVDKFYLTMLETTSEGKNREYSNFVQDYIDIEVELNSLLNKNQIRPLNKESTRNCEILLDYWKKYKEKHKKENGISDVDIELTNDYLRDLFIVIQIGEGIKENINN
ncbi:MAG: hypothetical protein HQ522_22695 [Bacteroidetes bacterium]|nr:hypothetical protein [Bacteroidota bacterium]